MAGAGRIAGWSLRAGIVAGALAAASAGLAQTAKPDLSTCDGEKYSRFVGKPVKAMQKLRKEKVRYVCTNCPMTMDYRLDRLTVTYFRRSGRIRDLRCV